MSDEDRSPVQDITTAPVAPVAPVAGTPSFRSHVGRRTGQLVDNWISVPTWYTMIRAIGLRPGRPLQRLVERHWHASR